MDGNMSTSDYGFMNVTNYLKEEGLNVTENPLNSTMLDHITTYKAKPIFYLAEDGTLNQYLEFKAAWVLDTIYAPICSSLGILGNIVSFLVLMLSKSTTTYQYMAAISCTDTLVLILNIMFLVRKFPGHEIFYVGTCKLILFLFFLGIHLNVILMVTMTVERYLAIKYPLKAPGWFSIRKARIVILVEVIVVTLLNFHNFFTREMIPTADGKSSICSSEGELNQFFLSKVWPWIDAVWYCYLPLACLCVLNILIVYQIKRAGRLQRKMTQSERGADSGKQDGSSKERQITTMLLLVTFTFLLLVSPMAIIILIEQFYWVRDGPHEEAVYHLVRTIFNNMMYTNHSLNFLLYFMSGKRFRSQFMDLICSCRKTPPLSTSSSRMTLSSIAGSTQSLSTADNKTINNRLDGATLPAKLAKMT